MNVSFPVNVTDFKPGSRWERLNGLNDQMFSWGDILRSAMVAGYRSSPYIPSPQFARWRGTTLQMALRRVDGQLIRPPEWDELDPSEKGAIKSILGVVVTKLLVERLLNAPIFLFLDVHFRVFPPGGLRPDVLASTPRGEWFSVESKGHEWHTQRALAKGKKQAESIGTVNGRPVQTGVVCLTSFRGGLMEAHLKDPPPDGEEPRDAKIDPKEVLRRYYSPLDWFRQVSEPLGEMDIPNSHLHARLWKSRELDVKFGIHPKLEQALQGQSPEHAWEFLDHLADHHTAQEDNFLGPDGIVVIPGESWKSEQV